MTTIFCIKLKKNAEALSFAPIPNELGKKIQQNISEQAWNMWLEYQTKLINEYKLNLIEDKARKFLKEQMNVFLFGEE